MQPLLAIPHLPTEFIPEPWGKAFRLIDRPTPFPSLIEPILQWRLDMEEAEWRIAFYWVIKKKWDPKLKIPLKRKQAKLYESWGELLFRTLELCEHLHNVAYPESRRYVNAADWYLRISQEAKRIGNDIIIDNEEVGKTAFVKERYAIIGSLKDQSNPANPQTSPHFHRLIEVALTQEPQDEFNNRYWKPFLQACSRWTQTTDTPPARTLSLKATKLCSAVDKVEGKSRFSACLKILNLKCLLCKGYSL